MPMVGSKRSPEAMAKWRQTMAPIWAAKKAAKEVAKQQRGGTVPKSKPKKRAKKVNGAEQHFPLEAIPARPVSVKREARVPKATVMGKVFETLDLEIGAGSRIAITIRGIRVQLRAIP